MIELIESQALTSMNLLEIADASCLVDLQVPHAQCLLTENPNFLPNFRPKNNNLKGN
jgi:hypothetical protein